MSSVLELLLADARTPSGGYAHSAGLEALLAEGPWEISCQVDTKSPKAPDIQAFIRARLETVGRVEAAFAAAACRASGSSALQSLLDLDEEWAARTLPAPVRRASRSLGRGLLRTAAAWFPAHVLISEYSFASKLTPRPIALGVIARAGGLDALSTARASLYDDAATVAAAAVKLTALDAAVAMGWVLALSTVIDALAHEAARAPAELPSTSTPLLDHLALTHANTERRLFAS